MSETVSDTCILIYRLRAQFICSVASPNEMNIKCHQLGVIMDLLEVHFFAHWKNHTNSINYWFALFILFGETALEMKCVWAILNSKLFENFDDFLQLRSAQ